MAGSWGSGSSAATGANLTADQIPNGVTLPSGFNNAANVPASYTGKFVRAFAITGTGSWGSSMNGQAATIYAVTGGGTVSGCSTFPCYVNNNTFLSGTVSGTITFDLSLHVTGAVSDSGLCKLTLNTVGFLSNGSFVNVQNVGGVTGCTGRFAVSNIGTNTIDLAASTFGGTFTSGGQVFPYDPNGTVQVAEWAQGTTWSNVTSDVLCRQSDYTNDAAGCTGWISTGCQAASGPRTNCSFNDDFLAGLKGANYGILRFLDANTSVFNTGADYAHWPQTSNFSYMGGNWLPSLWAGAISGTDTYAATCSGGCAFSLTDGSTIQGSIANVNATYTPTLNVNGTGALPILGRITERNILVFGGSFTAGDVLKLILTPSNSGCFSGSAHTISYTVNGMVVSGAGAGSGGAVKLTVDHSFPASNGDSVTVTGIVGTKAEANGTFTVTVVDFDAYSFAGNDVRPCLRQWGGWRLINTFVPTNVSASQGFVLNANSNTANALPVGLFAENPNSNGTINIHFAFNNGCGIALSKSVTGSGGGQKRSMLATLRRHHSNRPGNYSFTYSAIYNAYIEIGTNAGLGQSWPWPVQLALGKAVNAAVWLQLPLLWSTASMNSLSTFVNSNVCLPFGGVAYEVSNEVWNFANPETAQAYDLGFSLGFINGSFVSYYGLRMKQLFSIAKANWTNGNGLHLINAFDCCDGETASSIATYRMGGAELTTTSNPAYANAVGVKYNSAPNRPQDLLTEQSFAEYIGGILQGPDTGGYGGSFASFSCTTSAVSSNLLTVSGTCTGSVRLNEGVAGCDGVYVTSLGTGSGGAGTYHLNSTSCSIASGTITGGEILGLQYAADNYNAVCPSNCNSGSPYGSQADALAWADTDLRKGTVNGSLGAFTLAGYVANAFSTKGNIASLNLPLIEYEGGPDALAPTTGQAIGIGLPSTAYGGTGGYVDLLISGYKNSATFKQFTLDAMNAVVSNMPTHSLASKFNVEGGNAPWGIYPVDIYSTPFQDYNAAAAFN